MENKSFTDRVISEANFSILTRDSIINTELKQALRKDETPIQSKPDKNGDVWCKYTFMIGRKVNASGRSFGRTRFVTFWDQDDDLDGQEISIKASSCELDVANYQCQWQEINETSGEVSDHSKDMVDYTLVVMEEDGLEFEHRTVAGQSAPARQKNDLIPSKA